MRTLAIALSLLILTGSILLYAPAATSQTSEDGNLASPGEYLVLGLPCAIPMCLGASRYIISYHAQGEVKMLDHIDDEFAFHKKWLYEEFFVDNILRAMMMMTEQISAVLFQQAQIGGVMMDAKNQLETQRLTQELEYEAHKDYQPSEDFCYFGTNIRSMHASNAASDYTQLALNERNMKRHLGSKNTTAAGSVFEESIQRWKNFKTLYCDPADNARDPFGRSESGLSIACGSGASDQQRINADIDFTRIIEAPRTINADFTKSDPGPEGEDILALTNNLYGHIPITRQLPFLNTTGLQEKYMGLRAVTAKRNVAQNTMNAIISMKTSGSENTTGAADTAKFMGELLQDLGIPANETELMLGKNPSYYAQLETLSKRIAQSTEFYSNLYDKPANVARKGVALKALDLIIEREMYKSQLRREMLISVLLSSKLKRDFDITNRELSP